MKMAVLQSNTSCLLSAILTILLFSAMQLYKPVLANSPILGGFIGSWIFVFALTAVGNLETILFGKGVQAKMFPEVILCLLFALFSGGLVHRICLSTCLLFSIVHLYFVYAISQKTYSATEKVQPKVVHTGKKKK